VSGADAVAILDCGGQYTKVIDRRVRELRVRSEIFSIGTAARELQGFAGLILSGGPASVWTERSLAYDAGIFDLGIPILGICYGMHLMNAHFGGRVRPGVREEYGRTDIRIDPASALFRGLEETQTVLMSHGDSVASLAPGFRSIADSEDVVAAIGREERRLYGVQFHPEVDLTVHGTVMLENFLYEICGLEGGYTLEDRIQGALEKIRRTVGGEKVLVLVSGGVDSVVSAVLLLRALDESQVHAIHVDHGFMRKNESREICAQLERMGLRQLIRVDARETFLRESVEEKGGRIGPITEVTDPEEKRRIIGNLFMRVVYDALKDLELDMRRTFIAQGTLRPDLIESGNPDVSDHAHRIKTHHNDVDIVRQARAEGRIIETNWDWHKDEVREVARRLGVPEEIAGRQPFPGPGLAIRFLCHDDGGAVPDEALERFRSHVAERGLSGTVLPVRTVGVQGDCRSYRCLSVLWGAGLDADWKVLGRAATQLTGRLDFINRAAYLLNERRMPEGAAIHRLRLNSPDLDLLREVDAVVREALERPPVSQVFAVLLPVGREGRLSAAVRAVVTSDYMTARAAVIGEDIERGIMADLVARIQSRFPRLDLLFYDVTDKPPATVEWE